MDDHRNGCDACGQVSPPGSRFCVSCGARRHDDAPLDGRSGALVLGRFRLVEEIGAGAMGTVYRAEQRVGRFVRSVAVKILHPEHSATPTLRARFYRECELVVELSHANTIRFIDFGELEDGALAIVMELIEGETLQARIERGPLPKDEALHVAREIALSLEEAHAHGIVHRDLKPENVLLYERPGQRIGVKVLDFGIAKRRSGDLEDRALTGQGEILGTPTTMSPEQFLGGEIDARSDLYALGVIVYEMLTGELPFAPASCLAEWASRHLDEAPVPIDVHAIGASLSPECRDALMRSLAKHPEDRPAHVMELVDGLYGRALPPARRVSGEAAFGDERPTVPDLRVLRMSDPPQIPRARQPWLFAAFAAAILLGFAVASAAFVNHADGAGLDRANVSPKDPGSSTTLLAFCTPEHDPEECEAL